MQNRNVVTKLNELESLVSDATRRREEAAASSKKNGGEATPPVP